MMQIMPFRLGARLVKRAGLSTMAFRATANRLRILCYHGIWDAPGRHFGDKLFMSPSRFEQRLQALKRMGANVLGLSSALEALRSGTLPRRAVCITIDDGWASTFRTMVPALSAHGFPATLYMRTDKVDDGTPICPVAVRYALERTERKKIDVAALRRLLSDSPLAGDIKLEPLLKPDPRALFDSVVDIGKLIEARGGPRIDEGIDEFFGILGLRYEPLRAMRSFNLGTPDEIRGAAAAGLDIQLHTHRHYLGDLSPQWIISEVVDNRAALMRILGLPAERFVHFCYPSGRHLPPLYGALEQMGVESATTTNSGLASADDHPMALPRIVDGELIDDDRFEVLVSGLRSLLPKR